MTALAGIWQLDGRPGAAATCRAMLAAQAEYGRDDVAHWCHGDVAIGRNLAVLLPEDRFDHGPVTGGDGRFVLVGDVRIDNRDEIATAVGIDRTRVRAMSDAAVLMAAFERWREDCFAHILGDYAFAVWDAERRTLLLARDPAGQRPLHYHVGPGFVAFATMPSGLRAVPGFVTAPDDERLDQFLTGANAGSRTFLKGIDRVEIGHAVTLGRSGVVVRRHWDPPRDPILLPSPNEYVAAMQEQLDAAVRRRLRSIGEIGAQVSGGLDSTGVAATAARLLARTNRRVTAFTAVPQAGFGAECTARQVHDESPLAAAVVALYANMDHVIVDAAGRTMVADLDLNCRLAQRPALNLCNLGWYHAIHDAARARGVTVLLTGQSGNFTLSYTGLDRLAELVRAGRLATWAREAGAVVAATEMTWRGAVATSLRPFGPDVLWRLATRRLARDQPASTTMARAEGRAAARSASTGTGPRTARTDGFDARLRGLRRSDPGLNVKAALAGWGLDQRDPLADRRFVEFCLRVPSSEYLRDGRIRALARDALADRVPATVLNEPRRGHQAADWPERLDAARPALLAQVERFAANASASHLLDLDRMRDLLSNWPSGKWDLPGRTATYRVALLRAISAGHFACAARAAPGDVASS